MILKVVYCSRPVVQGCSSGDIQGTFRLGHVISLLELGHNLWPEVRLFITSIALFWMYNFISVEISLLVQCPGLAWEPLLLLAQDALWYQWNIQLHASGLWFKAVAQVRYASGSLCLKHRNWSFQQSKNHTFWSQSCLFRLFLAQTSNIHNPSPF